MTNESTSAELQDIKKKLQEDGFDPTCPEQSKVVHIWRLYVKAESDLEASLENIEQLRQQQSEEMKEVESYVEHIRSLSDEREALTVEFETENEILKQQIVKLQSQGEGGRNEEATEMLEQQGLDEIAHGTTSEQIAYLLVERARLLDELEAEQARNAVETSEGPMTAEQLLEILEQERQDFEEELENQKETVKVIKQQLNSTQGAEVEALEEENENLKSLLDQANSQITKLAAEIDTMQHKIESQMKDALNTLKEESNSGNASDEVKELQKNIDVLQQEKDNLTKSVETLDNALQAEKSQTEQVVSLKEKSIKRLQIEIDQQQKTIEDLERSLEDTGSDLQHKYQKDVKSLKSDQDEISKELEATMKALKLEKESSSKLEERITSLEEELRTLKKARDKADSDLRAKTKLAEAKVRELEDEIATRDRQNQLTERELKKDLENGNSELKHRVEDYEERLKNLREDHDEVETQLAQAQSKYHKSESKVKEQEDQLDWLDKTNSMLAEENTHLNKQLTDAGIETTKQNIDAEQSDHEHDKSGEDDEDDDDNDHVDATAKKLTSKRKQPQSLKTQDLIKEHKDLNDKLNTQLKDKTDENEQLRETLELKNSEIESLQKNVKSSGRDVLQYSQMERTLEDIKQENEQINAKLQKRDKDIMALKQQLDGESKNDGLVLELQSELSALKQSHQENVRVLDSRIEQLNTENQDLRVRLAQKDHSTNDGVVLELQSELSTLKQSHQEDVRVLDGRIEELNTENKQLRVSLAQKDHSKNDGLVLELQSELSVLKQSHKENVRVLDSRIEQLNADNKELRVSLTQKDHDITNLTLEVEAQQKKATRSEHLISEQKNKHTEQQNEVKILQGELKKKSQQCRDLEGRVSSTQTDQAARLVQAQTRADHAERRVNELQLELSTALSRLETLEGQTRELTILKNDLQVKDAEISSLRNQLTDEQLNRSLASYSSEEVKNQLNSFRDKEKELQRKNNDLQHMLLDVEAKLESMKNQTQSVAESRRVAEEGTKSLNDKVNELEQELEMLNNNLFNAHQQLSNQQERYAERKCRTKNKLQQARVMYNADKTKLKNEIEKLNHELVIAKNQLTKELEWKEHIEADQKRLLKEKRDLLTQLTEYEEYNRDQSRSLAMVQVKVKYLEEENNSLQQRVDSLSLQKHNLDRIVKEYQMERHREELSKQLTPQLASLISPRSHIHLLKNMSQQFERHHQDNIELEEVNTNVNNANIPDVNNVDVPDVNSVNDPDDTLLVPDIPLDGAL